MRILLVEDDQLLGSGIKRALSYDSTQVDWVTDGELAWQAISNTDFDLMILDLTLPKLDGLSVLDRVRKQRISVPVLILTARDTLEDKVIGLDKGADDYLPKPFELAELKARVRALLRRHSTHKSAIIEFQRLTININSYETRLDGQLVNLSRREFTLLHTLVSRPEQIFSKEKLEDAIYGWDIDIGSNSIEVHIHNLRKKLYPELIKNIRGVGYKVGL
jgi:two-component system response regulator QseB